MAPTADVDNLDALCDSAGLVAHTSDDWTDVKHSDRKTRDRLLPDSLVAELIRKSDWEGCRRLGAHLAILSATGWLVWRIWMLDLVQVMQQMFGAPGEEAVIDPTASEAPLRARSAQRNLYILLVTAKFVTLLVSLLLHGFVLQCLSYSCQHETLHRTAFKTKQLNIVVGFLASLPCFEFSAHEKIMHKPHHTWTNDPKRDPELTSFFDFKDSTRKGFRKVPSTRFGYWEEFYALHRTVYSHVMRIVNCAIGNPVDYSGVKWSLPEAQKRLVRGELQSWALCHIAAYVVALGAGLAGWYSPAHAVLLWLLPAILGFVPINLCRNAEHADTSPDQNGLTNTRSCMSTWPVRFLMWNMCLHREHHLYSAVPFFNLPRLRQELESVAGSAAKAGDTRKAHSIMRSTCPDGFFATNVRMYTQWIDAQCEEKEVNIEEE